MTSHERRPRFAQNDMNFAYLVLALLLGAVAGLRTMAAPTAVSWAARFGVLNVQGTPLAFFGYSFAPWVFTVFALGELVTDQLPSTPSRKAPLQFMARIASGVLCGAAVGTPVGMGGAAAAAGAIGAMIGTLGGYELRQRLANAFHKDRPAALVEDAGAIAGALLIVLGLDSLT